MDCQDSGGEEGEEPIESRHGFFVEIPEGGPAPGSGFASAEVCFVRRQEVAGAAVRKVFCAGDDQAEPFWGEEEAVLPGLEGECLDFGAEAADLDLAGSGRGEEDQFPAESDLMLPESGQVSTAPGEQVPEENGPVWGILEVRRLRIEGKSEATAAAGQVLFDQERDVSGHDHWEFVSGDIALGRGPDHAVEFEAAAEGVAAVEDERADKGLGFGGLEQP